VVSLEDEPTLADALAGGLGGENYYTFRICRELVDDSLLVSEVSIARAMSFLLETHHLVVEGGGAVGVAALLEGQVADPGRTAIVVSGGNVSIETLLSVTRGSPGKPGPGTV
jgi:threonine dehydratase